MDPHEEFSKNMQKLMHLLGKILKSQKEQAGADFSELLSGKKHVNLNVCIFTFLPMTPEDMDELEEMFDQMHPASDGLFHRRGADSELKFELNAKDMDFLKAHGIRF